MNALDPVSFRIVWSRLVGLVEEAAATLRRSAFSSIVSEGNDCSAVLFDRRGRELAEPSSYTATSFIGTLPRTLRSFLELYPPQQWRAGDVLICNDPWIGTGHVFDISIASPIFHRGELAAFFTTCSHTPNIGGNGGRFNSASVFEEGLRIPPTWLSRSGTQVTPVVEIIRANTPKPEQVLGDIAAQVSAHAAVAERLPDVMAETGQNDWIAFADLLHDTCQSAMQRAIAAIPDGRYEHAVLADGHGGQVEIHCAIDVKGSTLAVDFGGSSPAVGVSINSPLPYTLARTYYAIKAILLPTIPNNEATFRPINVVAPEGSIVNPQAPAPTANRHLVGHFIPEAVIGALSNAVPHLAVADGAGPAWSMSASGTKSGAPFEAYVLFGAGQGASAAGHGMDAVTYPGNAANTPVEILEQETNIIVSSKELRRNSGGAGRRRGGWGQRVKLKTAGPEDARVSTMGERTRDRPRGILGGMPGKSGSVRLNGRRVLATASIVLRPGDELEIQTPGGGGFGQPNKARAHEKTRRD